MNSNEYPDKELKEIVEWDYNDFAGLMEYVEELWKYPQYFNKFHNDKTNKTRYEISTGGWSGNEEIIDAMIDNRMFWAVCWLSSKCGGHYVFEVKDNQTELNNGIHGGI